MNTSFNAEAFLDRAPYKYHLGTNDFRVDLAVKHLLATPGLGTANAEITGVRWMTQLVSTKNSTRCLVGRGPSDKVAVVIYSADNTTMVACEKEMSEDIVLAMGDMLQCLAGGNAPWVRCAGVVLQAAFDIIFITAPKVDFQPEWRSDLDYLKGACRSQVDGAKGFVDNLGRRGILLSCDKADQKDMSSVVIFERYANDEDSPLVFNAPLGYTAMSTGLVDDVAHLHQRLLEAANIEVDTSVEM